MKHHKFHTTHIHHYKDGSAMIHHEHEDGPAHDIKHAVPSLDHIHDSLQDHLAEPSQGTQNLEQGIHGIPAEHAAPAGIPMPGGAPAPASGV
jgi:hypothetical protein